MFTNGERFFKADLTTQKLINKANLMTPDTDKKNQIIDLKEIAIVANPKSIMGDTLSFVIEDKNKKRSQIDLKLGDKREFLLWFAYLSYIVECNNYTKA